MTIKWWIMSQYFYFPFVQYVLCFYCIRTIYLSIHLWRHSTIMSLVLIMIPSQYLIVQGLWDNNERVTKSNHAPLVLNTFQALKATTLSMRARWILILADYSNHISQHCALHNSPELSVIPCRSVITVVSISLSHWCQNLLVQHLQQQQIALPCSCKLTWMMLLTSST